MNQHRLVIGLAIAVLALSGFARAQGPQPKESQLSAGRRMGWQLVQLVIEKLEAGPGGEFPGIAAWKQDFAKAAQGIDPAVAPEKWPAVDMDALVTRNPNFWRAYYEVAPGDPGLVLLHAGLLLSHGEATRASNLAVIAMQRPGVPAEVQKILVVVAGGSQRAGRESNALVEEGVKLFDAGDLAAALRKHEAALKLWPQNGWAHYEVGLTLRQQQWKAAGVEAPKEKIAINSGRKNSPEVDAAFTKARQHDPFQFKAYQGDDKEVIAGLMALGKKGLPAWQQLSKDPQQQAGDKVLLDLAEACQEANQHELALAARQIIVARRGRFLPEDHPFITKSLQKIAPGKATDATLQRLAGGKLSFRQLMAPQQ